MKDGEEQQGSTKRPNAKHVSRACLQCRMRHSKCDGTLPVCLRCERAKRECTYVKSNRGGSRRRGVTKKATETRKKGSTDIEDSVTLPCSGTKHAHKGENCSRSCLKPENAGKPPTCMSWLDDKAKLEFHPKFNASKQLFGWQQGQFFRSDGSLPALLPKLIRDINVNKIVDDYYKHFHNAHPFLPPQADIYQYLSSIPNNYDLLLAMKIMGTGQTTSKYAKDIETVQFLVENVIDYVRSVGKDLAALQAMLLLSMVAHISSLHDFSVAIRQELVQMTLDFSLHRLDEGRIQGDFTDANGFSTPPAERDTSDPDAVLNALASAPRMTAVDKTILLETARRTLWDVYFFDTLSGTATGYNTSPLSFERLLTLYPTSPERRVFDYKTRAESCKLVNEAIKLNVAVLTKEGDVDLTQSHMKELVSAWQTKIDNPFMFGAPQLVTVEGFVNEGVHQSILLGSYAKIFTHRPFSYLWKPDQTGKTDRTPTPISKEDETIKVLETRKAIESANSVAKTLIDSNLSRVTSRTPFFACALAFATLVHLSAYSWVESSLNFVNQNRNSPLANKVTKEELDIYVMYITLELNGIYAISRHWSLSAKLIAHIKETLATVSPPLYEAVNPSFPEFKATPLKVEEESSPVKVETQSVVEKEAESFRPMQSPLSSVGDRWTSLSDASSFPESPAVAYSDPSPSSSLKTAPHAVYSANSMGLDGTLSTGMNWSADKARPMNILEETDYNNVFGSFADTGCDWVDKNMTIFEFDDFNFLNGLDDN